MAVWRLETDVAVGDWKEDEKQITWGAFWMVMKDWKNWFLVVLVYCTGAALSVNQFFPSVIATLGRSKYETLLLTSPPYLLSCFVMFFVCWSADRTQERYWHLTLPLWSSLIGFILVGASTNFGARYFGAMIMIPGMYVAFNLSIVWTANTIYSPPGKRACALAFNNAFSGLAGLYSAYLFPDGAAPRYAIALGVNAGMLFLGIVTATIFRFVLARENKKIILQEENETDDSRLTHPRSFRYVY